MMHRLSLPLLFCTALAGLPAAAQTHTGTFAIAVHSLAAQYDTCYARKDAGCMAKLYETDGELVSPAGDIVRGRTALETYYRKRFASGATNHHIVILETQGDSHFGFSVASFTVSVPPKTEQGHIAAVYARDDMGWHFALVQPSVTPAARQ